MNVLEGWIEGGFFLIIILGAVMAFLSLPFFFSKTFLHSISLPHACVYTVHRTIFLFVILVLIFFLSSRKGNTWTPFLTPICHFLFKLSPKHSLQLLLGIHPVTQSTTTALLFLPSHIKYSGSGHGSFPMFTACTCVLFLPARKGQLDSHWPGWVQASRIH